MILHKIFVKGEFADKYSFLDSIVQQQELEEIYQFYKALKFDKEDFKLKKISYQPDQSFLQIILVDTDNTRWKHNYKAIEDEG